MKKIAALVLLFISANVSGQNEAAEDTATTPVITAVGNPKGKKTEIKINKDGGSLKSSDGLVELIFPAGALSKKTDISIQPITNLMTNGDGIAYRFEPSGIQFKKTVQVIFHYDDEEIQDSMQLLLGIAMQDAKGQWHSLNETALDTVAKTISGNINHFSDWGKFRSIKLYPTYSRLKVKKQLTLTIDLIANEEEELLTPLAKGDNDLLSPLKNRKIPWRSSWRATSGEITKESKTTATYTAPPTPPAKNPAAITADLNGLTYTTKVKGELMTFKDLKLVSNILIYDDAYEVTMISEIQDPGVGSNLGAVTYKDTGSFVVSLNGKEARIIEKVNKNISASLEYAGGCCYNYRILKTGTGNIHIAGTPVIKVTPPAASGSSSMIEITFGRVPSIFPLFQVTCQCPGDKSPTTGTNAQGVAMMAGILPAFPQIIKFEAREGEQTILEHGQPGGQLYTKFTVKQLKED
ncbi:MAG: hypothetical protein ACXWV6_01465 [Chitinophagaceae bacterium]